MLAVYAMEFESARSVMKRWMLMLEKRTTDVYVDMLCFDGKKKPLPMQQIVIAAANVDVSMSNKYNEAQNKPRKRDLEKKPRAMMMRMLEKDEVKGKPPTLNAAIIGVLLPPPRSK